MSTAVDGSGDTGPPSTDVVIDAFEDGNLTPDDQRFATWKVEVLDNATQERTDGQLSVAASAGHDGQALQLVWQVQEVLDGQVNHPGVMLVMSLNTYIDLSAYSSLVFAHKYEHQGTCQAVPLVTVAASCSAGDARFETSAPLSPAWTATTIPFADLQPAVVTSTTREDCLRQIYEIDLCLEVSLSEGDCASGTLWLDDVALRL
jgi:hypothetical protein